MASIGKFEIREKNIPHGNSDTHVVGDTFAAYDGDKCQNKNSDYSEEIRENTITTHQIGATCIDRHMSPSCPNVSDGEISVTTQYSTDALNPLRNTFPHSNLMEERYLGSDQANGSRKVSITSAESTAWETYVHAEHCTIDITNSNILDTLGCNTLIASPVEDGDFEGGNILGCNTLIASPVEDGDFEGGNIRGNVIYGGELPPSYKTLTNTILNDPPPRYEAVTGIPINVEEVSFIDLLSERLSFV